MIFLDLRAFLKDLIIERIEILLENALKNARENMDLAQRQAFIARRLCMKFNFRMSYEKRQLFCRRCKKFIISGINAYIRLDGKIKAIKIKCMECGHVYRKISKRKTV